MPALFDTFRFTANNGSDQAVTPITSGLKRSWQREGDTRSYRMKLNTKMVFSGADYAYFRAIYDAGDCNEVSFLIENYCGGAWSAWFEGIVPIFKGEYIASRCQVTFDIMPNDVYECAKKGFSKNSNWLGYATPVSVKTNQAIGTIETISCQTAVDIPLDLVLHFVRTCWAEPVTSSPDPDPVRAYRPISHQQHFTVLLGVFTLNANTTWARETVDSATMPPGNGWVLLSGTTWVRPVSVGLPVTTFWSHSAGIDWEAQIINSAPVSNGRALGEVLTAAVLALDCDFDSVVSDFFNINPDATAPTNDAYTFAADNFQNIFFFQKSDIVRATASNDATRFTTNLKEFFEEMKILNVFYAITNVAGVKTLRIEHYTYFNGSNGLDLVTLDGGKYIAGLDSFEKDDDVPNFESFAYQESYRPDFLYQRIDYPAGCSTTQGDERQSKLLCTDFGGLIENPDAGLEGFFLLATEDLGGGEFLMSTLSGEANGAFAWKNILPALWADGRFHLDATSTVGVGYVVNSVRKSRAQPQITARFCCSQAFEPSDLVQTQLGWGEVKTAEQDTELATLKLTLLQ
jgi:hypothetical protein